MSFIFISYHIQPILALICFGIDDFISVEKCELFDGLSLKKSIGPGRSHLGGELSFYNGRPTAVGGEYADGEVETLTKYFGWFFVQKHPK